MTNAKQELERLLEGKAKVKCAEITKGYQEPCPKFTLKVNHTEEEYQEFLKLLSERGYKKVEIE